MPKFRLSTDKAPEYGAAVADTGLGLKHTFVIGSGVTALRATAAPFINQYAPYAIVFSGLAGLATIVKGTHYLSHKREVGRGGEELS